MDKALRARARALGFDAVGVARADAPWEAGARLEQFLTLGRHGEMGWLSASASRARLSPLPLEGGGAEVFPDSENRNLKSEPGKAKSPDRLPPSESPHPPPPPLGEGVREAHNCRAHPSALWPEAKCAILLGQSYAPGDDALTLLERKREGLISAYAARRDYHDVIKAKLKTLGHWLAVETGAAVKVFVDTAPLMEKPLAERAGLGWQGKHTTLVSRTHGSWLFLGAILTSAELEPDAPHPDHCGQCRACLDVCPTKAFPAPYQLDARRCLAYLTIEHKSQIPLEFREALGNRVFGCDDCLAVCPWNKFAQTAQEARLALRQDLRLAPLAELAALDEASFRARFAGTPVKRTGRDRFVRNVACGIGNSGDISLAPAAAALLDDASPLVRGMAVWALRRLLDAGAFAALKSARAGGERDPGVGEEWES